MTCCWRVRPSARSHPLKVERRADHTSGPRRNSGFNDRLTSFVVQPRGYAGNSGGAYNGYNGSVYGGRSTSGYNGSGYGGRTDGAYGDPYRSGSYRGGTTYGSNNTRWTYPQAEAMVRQGYRRVLGREPDPGARSWVNEVVRNGWSQRQLESALRDSPEARGR